MSQNPEQEIAEIAPDSIEGQLQRANQLLPVGEYNMLKLYINSGKHSLAPETCAKFFELYLNGSSCAEIHRLNKPFPYEAILWARIKFSWDKEKDLYILNLQTQVREKVMKAQLETTNLLSDLMVVTSKKHSDKLKRYLLSGNEKDLDGVIGIDTIMQLGKLTESLLKITGQDRVTKNTNETKQTTEVNINTKVDGTEGLSSESASKILAIIADEKRANAKINQKK
jgi:hypothetical protein